MPWSTPKASTKARGYGHQHQVERRRRLPHYTAADPCGYCGQPLGTDRSRWHLPHNDDRTGYLPGFWHAACNISDGSRRGRAKQDQPKTSPLKW